MFMDKIPENEGYAHSIQKKTAKTDDPNERPFVREEQTRSNNTASVNKVERGEKSIERQESPKPAREHADPSFTAKPEAVSPEINDRAKKNKMAGSDKASIRKDLPHDRPGTKKAENKEPYTKPENKTGLTRQSTPAPMPRLKTPSENPVKNPENAITWKIRLVKDQDHDPGKTIKPPLLVGPKITARNNYELNSYSRHDNRREFTYRENTVKMEPAEREERLVNVNIGRIEIRAVRQVSGNKTKPSEPEPGKSSLNDYLKQRDNK